MTVVAAATLSAFCGSEPRPGVSASIDSSGSRLAYYEYQRANNDFRLVVEDLSTARRRVLDDQLASIQPAWSPDGKSVAYVKFDAASSTVLSIVNVDSGARRAVSLGDAGPPIGLAWISAGQLAFGAGGKLEILDLETGTVLLSRDLATLDLQPDFASLSVNAAGVAAFAVNTDGPDTRTVWTLALRSDAAPQRLTEGHDDASPAWLDEHRILFSRGDLGTSERHLWLVDVRTKEARQVTTGPVMDILPTVNSRSVFFTRIEVPKAWQGRTAGGNWNGGEGMTKFLESAQIVSIERSKLR
ncbi:MAG TPA: hypothetical protein VJZ76_23220 [Thermoanaerobaculia bacterium]|nr:hypothetical protein [Thermoanaerobaculia bacterium]